MASIVGFYFPDWTETLLSASTSYGILNLLAMKSYLLFFQHRYHTAIQNKIWAQEINNNWNNWYIRNKNKWGNFHYILKWLIIPYCLESFITAFGKMICGFTVTIIFQAIFATTPILMLLICAIKLGHFYDSFGIRRELLMQFIMFIISIPIYFSIVLGLRAHLSDEAYNVLVEMLQGILIITLYTILAISSAYYPLHLIKYKNKHQLTLPESNNNITMCNLLECFIDYQMFSFFMNHLVKEFATESALFVVEYAQIKNAYQSHQNGVIKISNKSKSFSDTSQIREPYVVIDLNDHEHIDNINMIPTLPKAISISSSKSIGSAQDIIPDMILSSKSLSKSKSKIYMGVITTYLVEQAHTENMIKIQIAKQVPESGILQQYPNDIKLQIKALYNKYIMNGCEHQINIPFSLQNPATQLMIKLETENQSETEFCEGDLWCSMDSICLNILGLLLNPYSRFKIGQEYIEYVNSTEYKSFNKELEMMESNNKEGPKIFEGSLYDQICDKYKL